MCGNDGSFQRTGHCASDEWCAGSANATTAVSDGNIAELCSKGKFDMV